ncbi:MAG: radical SAM protein [Candidatus Aminicenantales bacterium]
MPIFEPIYQAARRSGLLEERVSRAAGVLESCSLCPRRCGTNRLRGEKGYCRAGWLPAVSSYNPHFGEEDPLVGLHGSGTIFLTHCNLRCCFCQNYDISHEEHGREVGADRLAEMMLELQGLGCHNINFVTPTHYVPQILKALAMAAARELSVPLVYNTGGYDAVETLRLLDGIFDIYMPDLKFMDGAEAEEFCEAPDYPQAAQAAILEMHRQVGDLVLDERGIAQRGLLVRHLVLPEGLAGTREAMRFLAAQVSRNTYVNIMDQYRPCGEVTPRSPLRRRITQKEFEEALRAAQEEGLARLDRREQIRIRLF